LRQGQPSGSAPSNVRLPTAEQCKKKKGPNLLGSLSLSLDCVCLHAWRFGCLFTDRASDGVDSKADSSFGAGCPGRKISHSHTNCHPRHNNKIVHNANKQGGTYEPVSCIVKEVVFAVTPQSPCSLCVPSRWKTNSNVNDPTTLFSLVSPLETRFYPRLLLVA